MTLSGGTTGLSFSISDSSFLGSMTWLVSERVGFMITAWGERAQKNVEWRNRVCAWRRAGIRAHVFGEVPIS